MKAQMLINKGSADKAFQLVELKEPEVKTGELKISCEGFGLNYADVMARNGLYREAPPIPFVPGYEVVGVVSEGPKEWIGKRVIAFTRFGGYAQRVVTPIAAAVVIPESLPIGEALALATQYVTAYHAAIEMVNLFPGDRVLIHAAAGGVGIALTQLAKWKQCEVYGTASQARKLEFLKQNGVDHPINYRSNDYKAAILEKLNGERLDVAFNSIGGSTFKKDRELVGSAGRQVLYGGAERSGKRLGILSTLSFVQKMGLTLPIGLMMRSKGIIGVNMLKIADNKPHVLSRCMSNVVDLYQKGLLKPVVDQVYSVEDIAKAHSSLENRGTIGKVAVSWR